MKLSLEKVSNRDKLLVQISEAALRIHGTPKDLKHLSRMPGTQVPTLIQLLNLQAGLPQLL